MTFTEIKDGIDLCNRAIKNAQSDVNDYLYECGYLYRLHNGVVFKKEIKRLKAIVKKWENHREKLYGILDKEINKL